jgi:hypothetical protein
MTAPRMPRHTPLWRHTQPSVHTLSDVSAIDAPAASQHQACPPCTGNCQQGRSCPADGPRGAGEWGMVVFIGAVLAAAVLLGPMVRSMQ